MSLLPPLLLLLLRTMLLLLLLFVRSLPRLLLLPTLFFWPTAPSTTGAGAVPLLPTSAAANVPSTNPRGRPNRTTSPFPSKSSLTGSQLPALSIGTANASDSDANKHNGKSCEKDIDMG
jgi:hypothetical protein